FVSYPWAGASVLSQHWFTTWLQPFAFLTLSDEWSAKDRVKELSPIPILVMHGTKDQAIDFRLGERLYAEAAEPKEFYRIEGGRHIDSFWAHDGRVKKDFLERAERVVREKWWAKAQ